MFSLLIRRCLRTVRMNPQRLRIMRDALTREEKKEFLKARYHPEEYESPPPIPTEIQPEVKKVFSYPQDQSGLLQFLKDETEQEVELIQVPTDRGLPFDHIGVVILTERRARRALADALAHTFKSFGPVYDMGDVTVTGRSKRRKNKGTVEIKEEWITLNLPGLALIHIMHPQVAAEYNFKEMWATE